MKICYLIFSSYDGNLNHRRMQLEDETCLTYYRLGKLKLNCLFMKRKVNLEYNQTYF